MDKKDFPYDQTHKAIPLETAIGVTVRCEDGELRLVERIVHCAGSFQFAVINEDLEGGKEGSLVHLLKLFAQLRGAPEPSASELHQFDEIAKSFDFEYKKPGEGDGIFARPAKKKKNHSKSWFANKEGKT